MRLLLPLILLFQATIPGPARIPGPVTVSKGSGTPPSLVGGQVCQNQANTGETCTLPGNTTTGNMVVVYLGLPHGANAISVSLTGATFSALNAACVTQDNNFDLYWYLASTVTGGNSVLTITWGNTASAGEVEAAEFNPGSLSGVIDGSDSCNTGASSTGTISSGTSTSPAGVNELALGDVRQDVTSTTLVSTNGFTDISNTGNNFGSNYKVISAATTAQWTNSATGHPYAADVVVIK
jgi:hypothetical protein